MMHLAARAILTEITELREVLIDLANTRDARGHSLFAGFKNEETAFVSSPDGKLDIMATVVRILYKYQKV